MELKIQTAAKVGEQITKLVKSAVATAEMLHSTAIQCVLHIREHGDTSLFQRLLDELNPEKQTDANLKPATALNVQGLRFWAGCAAPMTIREGTIKLMDKDSDGYNKYLVRMAQATTDKDHPEGQPDSTMGPGSRIFFLEWCSEHPFWDMTEVQREQNRNIKIMGVSDVIAGIFQIERTFNKAVADNAFGGNVEIAKDFIQKAKEFANQFRAANAATLINEPEALEEFKLKLAEPVVEAAEELASEQPPAQVGGDVAANLTAPVEPPPVVDETVDDPAAEVKTGTEG